MLEARYKKLISLLSGATSEQLDYWRYGFEGKGDPLKTSTGNPTEPGYSEEEKALLLSIAENWVGRIQQVEKRLSSSQPDQTQTSSLGNRLFLAFAGPAGSGKSTLSLRTLADAAEIRLPDDLWSEVTLKKVIDETQNRVPVAYLNTDRGFLLDIFSSQGTYKEHNLDFYKHWAWASRFLTSVIGMLAVQSQIPILRDATFSNPTALDEIRSLGKKYAPPIMVLLGASDATRYASMEMRANQGYVQSNTSVTETQKEEFDRNIPEILNTIGEKGGIVYFALRNNSNKGPQTVAKLRGDVLEVCDKEGFASYCELFPKAGEAVSSRIHTPCKPIELAKEVSPYLRRLVAGITNQKILGNG